MRKLGLSLILLCAVLAVGCKPKPKEVSGVARAQALQLASEAQISAQLRDYAKAVESLTKATELDPEIPAYWSGLGVNRARKGDKSGAKKAYQRALSLYEELAKKNPKETDPLIKQIEPLILLGRVDDARKLLDKAVKDFPKDSTVRTFVDEKIIDQLAADPSLKEVSL